LFCRNIGKLARTIKNRSKPELNLINRYQLAQGIRHRSSTVYQSGALDSHPLIPLGAVNSSTVQTVQVVQWPVFGKHNSKYRWQDRAGKEKVKERLLLPLLGKEVMDANRGRYPHFFCRKLKAGARVRVGPWRFGVAAGVPGTASAHGATVKQARHSFFSIKAKWVHQMNDWMADPASEQVVEEMQWRNYWQPETILIGQFHELFRLEIVGWTPSEFHIGKCTLWMMDVDQNRAEPNVFVVDSPLNTYVRRQRADGSFKETPIPVCYVPLQHVETAVGLGPVGEPAELSSRKVKKFYAVRLMK
jgi:hypothetical protein